MAVRNIFSPGPSRREMLQVGLGAGMAALVGARCKPRRGVPDGQLHDFGRQRAHAHLRGEAPALSALGELSSWPRRRAQVVVVGAGIAGLSAAWRLKRAGVEDVLVLELGDRPGGTAQGGVSPVTAYPWGAHYVVTPGADYPAFTTLLDELGVLDGVDAQGRPQPREEHACREPEERHFRLGKFHAGLYPLAGETGEERAQRQRFSAVLGRWAGHVDAQGQRAFTLPVARCSDHADLKALDAISFSTWLKRQGFTSWRLRWLCNYACRDDYGATADRVSAWAGLLYFCARKDARADGTVDGGRSVITWAEGNDRLVRHLAAPLASRLITGRVAVDVSAQPEGGVQVLTHGNEGPLMLDAQHAVVAVPGFVAQRVVGALRQAPPPVLPPMSAWAVVNLHLAQRPKDRGQPFAEPMAWDTVFTESASLGYVVATHQSGRDHGPTVLTWYRPLTEGTPDEARQRLLSLPRESWAEAALSELELAHPDIRDVVTRVDVGRFGHAMVTPVPGLWSSGELAARQAPLGNIHLAHTDLSGLALCEEAFYHGVRAAEEILVVRDPQTRSML